MMAQHQLRRMRMHPSLSRDWWCTFSHTHILQSCVCGQWWEYRHPAVVAVKPTLLDHPMALINDRGSNQSWTRQFATPFDREGQTSLNKAQKWSQVIQNDEWIVVGIITPFAICYAYGFNLLDGCLSVLPDCTSISPRTMWTELAKVRKYSSVALLQTLPVQRTCCILPGTWQISFRARIKAKQIEEWVHCWFWVWVSLNVLHCTALCRTAPLYWRANPWIDPATIPNGEECANRLVPVPTMEIHRVKSDHVESNHSREIDETGWENECLFLAPFDPSLPSAVLLCSTHLSKVSHCCIECE